MTRPTKDTHYWGDLDELIDDVAYHANHQNDAELDEARAAIHAVAVDNLVHATVGRSEPDAVSLAIYRDEDGNGWPHVLMSDGSLWQWSMPGWERIAPPVGAPPAPEHREGELREAVAGLNDLVDALLQERREGDAELAWLRHMKRCKRCRARDHCDEGGDLLMEAPHD